MIIRFLPLKNIFFVLSIALLVSSNGYSQVEPVCGFVATPEAQERFERLLPQIKKYEQEYYNKSLSRSSTAISSIPIKAHILRTSSGTGGLTVTQLNDAIANMNAYYANAYIEFFLCDGINYIDDSTYYDFETNEQSALTSGNNVNNVINIYFANTVTSSDSGGGLCGYAYFPGGPEVILMDNGCAINGSTLPHEMGHFFALYHTHGPSNSALTTELVNGTNCDTNGDLICDTPADPQLSYSNVTGACNYIGTDTDANGDTFVPDPQNIMSYSRKECRTLFSPQQYARIYATFQTSRNNLSCPSFNVAFDANYTRDCSNSLTVNFTDSSVGATSWQWDIDGDDIIDYTTQNPTHVYNEGVFDVTLTISNGTSSLTKVYSELIEVGSNSINTTQLLFTLTTDNWPAETTWEFKDSNDIVLYSGGPYIEGTHDFTTFNETFNIVADECYTLTVSDSYGDGICCASGTGSYELKTLENVVIATGGDYGFGEETYMSNQSLGVDDYFINNKISVYPNPTNTVLNIKLNQNSNLPDSYKIYNMLGQLIDTKEINNISHLKIETSTLNNGMYFIKIFKDDQFTSIPFIKN